MNRRYLVESLTKRCCYTKGLDNLDLRAATAYDDKTLYEIAAAGSTILKLPVPELIEKVGYHFYTFIKGTPYAKMLDIAGSSFVDLLKNLNALHGHMVKSHFKEMKSPQFRAVVEMEGKVAFFYTPGTKERVGLDALLVGLLRAVAELKFSIPTMNIVFVKRTDDGTSEFLVTWEEDSTC